MQTNHDESVAKIYVLVDELMKRLRKAKKDLDHTSQLLAQYCLQESTEASETWVILLMLKDIADLPPKVRNQISETLARLNAWAMGRKEHEND